MIVTTLLPVLAVLASPALARTSHPNTGADRRGLSHHQVAIEHARNVEKISQAVRRRDELAESLPRALDNPIRRVQKRGASGCRAKDDEYTTSVTSSVTASSTADYVSASTASTTSTTSTTDSTSYSSTPVAEDYYSSSSVSQCSFGVIHVS